MTILGLRTPQAAVRFVVLSSDPVARNQLAAALCRDGGQVHVAACPEEAQHWLSHDSIDVVLIDDGDGNDRIRQIADHLELEHYPTQIVRVVSASSPWGRDILPTFQYDVLERPFTQEQLERAVRTAAERCRLMADIHRLRKQLTNRGVHELIGHSSAAQELREQIASFAELDSPVLIEGESGSGTNVVARAIHQLSRRCTRPFIRMDCSVLTSECAERELFGVGKRAGFGPAVASAHATSQQSRIEVADGGTLLLDNVECLSLPLQKRLTSFMKGDAVRRHQGRQDTQHNIRIMVASHAGLAQLIGEGRFHARLHSVFESCSLRTVPLRDRIGDLPYFVEHILNGLSTKEGLPPRRITVDAMERLQQYGWPGNVGELHNVLERACAVEAGPLLTASAIAPWLGCELEAGCEDRRGMSLRDMERKLIETTFERFAGNRERTAQALKIGIRTLSGKLREYGYPPRGGPGSNMADQLEDHGRRAA